MTPWTVAHQTPLSTGFSRQEYWIGLPFPSPGDLPDPGTKPRSPTLQADSLPTELGGKPKVKVKVAQSCPALFSSMDCSPWNSPGQDTGVGSLSLLQGILPIQGENPGLLHCRWILHQLSHQGSPLLTYMFVYFCCAGSSFRQAFLAAASRGRFVVAVCRLFAAASLVAEHSL